MPEMFKAKVRPVGTSVGIIIPRKIMVQEKIKPGEEVEVALIKPRSPEEIEREIRKIMGIAKGAKPFKREHKDHEF